MQILSEHGQWAFKQWCLSVRAFDKSREHLYGHSEVQRRGRFNVYESLKVQIRDNACDEGKYLYIALPKQVLANTKQPQQLL